MTTTAASTARKTARAAFATEIAPSNGWAVTANVFAPRADGVEFDIYWADADNDTPDVTIGWTKNHTAAFVLIGAERVNGALALIEARKHIEANAVAAA